VMGTKPGPKREKQVGRLLEEFSLYGLGLPVVRYRRIKKYLQGGDPSELIGGVKD